MKSAEIFGCSLLDEASDNSVAEIMDSEDPLFILYTSGSPENLRYGSYHCWIYGLYGLYFKNVFNYEENDIFGVPLIGWITGHSYILYGPLLNGATTVIFEGVPSIQISVVFGDN
jgi:acetyl-CoA synthetase